MNSVTVAKRGKEVESPVVFGMAVVVDTGKLLPVEFTTDGRGPGVVLRSARTTHGRGRMKNIYE